MKLSFVIPVYNEEQSILELHRRIKKVLEKDFPFFDYEIIMVDDGSTDNSFKIMKGLHDDDKNIKVIKFSRNFGHHIAITAGLDVTKGDFVVLMDGDLQDQPEEIIKLWNEMQKGYDVVYGRRKNKKFGFFKVFTSTIFNFILRRFMDKRMEINSSIFRIMTKQVIEQVRRLREADRYVIGLIGWVGFKHSFREVIHGDRYAGKTKYNLRKEFTLAFNAIFSFSNFFIKLISVTGLIIILISLILLIWILVVGKVILSWSLTVALFFFMGGLEILFIGIIGMYIARIYSLSKGRPLYIIETILD